MKLLFVHDHRFLVTGGVVYSNQFPAAVLRRYLGVFDNITFVGRKRSSVFDEQDASLVSTMPGVNFVFMPNISTPKSFLGTRRAVSAQIVDLLHSHDRLIVRLPSELGLLAAAIARQMGRSYAVELVGCPWDSLWYYGTFTAKIYAPLQARRSRVAVRKAQAVCYVTADYLQKRYPAGAGVVTANISNVAISSDIALYPVPPISNRYKRIKVGIIGSLHTRYKGIHTAIDAIARLVQQGADVELRVLGSGDQEALAMQAEKLQIFDRVFFDGTLPAGAAVRGWLDQLDIYAQPSLTEGLPRALIEAMSRGLPATASHVGGIPELLGENFLFPPNDAAALTDRLRTLIESPDLRAKSGKFNADTAAAYRSTILDARREKFLHCVRNLST